MQRHFSNRGEALAEVTAARVLARRKAPVKSAFTARAGGRFLRAMVLEASDNNSAAEDKTTTRTRSRRHTACCSCSKGGFDMRPTAKKRSGSTRSRVQRNVRREQKDTCRCHDPPDWR